MWGSPEEMSTSMKLSLSWVLKVSAIFCGLIPGSLLAQEHRVAVLPPAPIVTRPGAVVTQQTRVSVQPGFHVNSDKPKDEYVIPLKLTWLGGPLTIESITYPKPEEIKVGTEDLTVFTGDFTIESRFRVPQQVPRPGSSTMNGKLRYQACNNQMCLRPATVDVHVPITIQ